MPCFKPLKGWGKLGGGITFSPVNSNQVPLTVPCGQCIGCRVDRQKEWALRLCHEIKSHDRTTFLTLTYSPEHLPRGGTLVKSHVQSFIKRLRRYIEYRSGKKIRFFACGEYGENLSRPHYHLLIFGWEPHDAKVFTRKDNYTVYTSEVIRSLWPYGFNTWSPGSPENAMYVSHYTIKKINGPMAKEHYTRITQDGEMIEIQPEFALMSKGRNGDGLGARHYQKYKSDFRDNDSGMIRGKKTNVPRYYDKLYEREHSEAMAKVKDVRKAKARKHRENNTPERLATREKVMYAKLRFNSERKGV